MVMPNEKKILYVVNNGYYFLSHRRSLALAAANQGFSVHVAAPKGSWIEEVQNLGFTFHDIPFTRRGMNPLKEVQCLWNMISLYRELRPDLLHHLTIKPVLYGSFAAKMAGLANIVNAVTGLGYVFVQNGSSSMVLRWGVMKAYQYSFRSMGQKIIFQNPDDLALFLKNRAVTEKKTVLIRGSGVNIVEFFPRQEPLQTPLVVLASRMLWDKGVREFVKAATILKQENVNARFALVGDPDPGNPTAISTQFLKKWSDTGIVEWWGHRKNMAEVLAQAAVVCLPSYYREGVPRVLLEAAALARPIVTTDEPGCREIVRDGVNGFLVPSRNSPALAEALKKLIFDPKLRQQMGERGRKIVEEEFSEEIVIRETLALYEEILQSRS